MAVAFVVSFLLLTYVYFGYPLLVFLLARLFGRDPERAPITPSVSLLIPAYNEEGYVEGKIRNSLTLDYPREQLEIVVASDGSTDRTNAIVQAHASQGIGLLAMEANLGKSAMLTRVVPQLRGEIIVFSDTSSELEPQALRRIVQRFHDPRVGCVSGVYRLKEAGKDLRGEGEGLYWRYEMFIKRQEGRLHSILGAHGAFYAIRKALFAPLETTAINDDYLVPMRIVAQGYRAVQESLAVSWERELASMEGEFARRRRIAAGNCQQVVMLRHLLHPRYGWVALSFFSHKLLRTLAPLFMVAMLVATPGLAQPWQTIMWALQGLLYGGAVLGYAVQRSGRRVPWLTFPFYFCLGNLAMLAGIIKYLASGGRPTWERSRQ